MIATSTTTPSAPSRRLPSSPPPPPRALPPLHHLIHRIQQQRPRFVRLCRHHRCWLWPSGACRLFSGRSAVSIPHRISTEPILSTRPLSVVIDCSYHTTHGTLNEGEGCFEVHDKSGAGYRKREHAMNMKQQSTGARNEMIWWMWMGGCNNHYSSQH